VKKREISRSIELFGRFVKEIGRFVMSSAGIFDALKIKKGNFTGVQSCGPKKSL
jgi:hypothetical protein